MVLDDAVPSTAGAPIGQDKKQPYSRREAAGLVILVQGFITIKMVVSCLALWEVLLYLE